MEYKITYMLGDIELTYNDFYTFELPNGTILKDVTFEYLSADYAGIGLDLGIFGKMALTEIMFGGKTKIYKQGGEI